MGRDLRGYRLIDFGRAPIVLLVDLESFGERAVINTGQPVTRSSMSRQSCLLDRPRIRRQASAAMSVNRLVGSTKPSVSVVQQNAVPSGRTCTSTRAFETSMPIRRSVSDLASIPRCGLVPRRRFGFIRCRRVPHAPSRLRRPGTIRATGRARSANLAQPNQAMPR